jgi:hypothetical protein
VKERCTAYASSSESRDIAVLIAVTAQSQIHAASAVSAASSDRGASSARAQ